MSDLKRIGTRSLMQRLANVLGIEGVSQRAPISLDTSRLVPVISMDAGMAGAGGWHTVSPPLSIAGISQASWMIVGNDSGAVIFDPYRKTGNGDLEYVVMGLRVTIAYDAAGALLDVGQTNNCDYFRKTTPGGGSPTAYESHVGMGVVEDVGGTHYYLHTFPMYLRRQVLDNVEGGTNITALPVLNIRPLWVPAGSVFGLTISKNTGAVWPANTTVEVQAWGVRSPKGMLAPGI